MVNRLKACAGILKLVRLRPMQKHDFPGNISACVIEQSYAERLDFGESQESALELAGLSEITLQECNAHGLYPPLHASRYV